MILDLDNGYNEYEIEVDYDYEPYEPSTWTYPGCSEAVYINAVKLVSDEPNKEGSEICLLPGVEDSLAETILDILYHEKDY